MQRFKVLRKIVLLNNCPIYILGLVHWNAVNIVKLSGRWWLLLSWLCHAVLVMVWHDQNDQLAMIVELVVFQRRICHEAMSACGNELP